VNLTKFHHRQKQADFELPFGIRAASALGIAVIADGLDYVGAPLFALPVIGDITDLIVTGLLYRLTKSKVTVVINAIEFIPFIGDFIPTYTISTVLWILNESRKRNNRDQPTREKSLTRVINRSADATSNSQNESLQTKIMRTIAIWRSKTNE
jgi:hypothetical protein